MAAKLTERQVVPFHLTLTEPIGETSIAGYPAAEGAYDPVEQIWKLPDGTALSDSNARKSRSSHVRVTPSSRICM